MKKRLLILALVAQFGVVVCSANVSQSTTIAAQDSTAMAVQSTEWTSSVELKTQKDSLAYALGLDMGAQFFNSVDPEMNYELICRGVRDIFERQSTIEPIDVSVFLQNYFTVVVPQQQAEANGKSSAIMLDNAAKQQGAQVSETGLVYIINDEGGEHKVSDGDLVDVSYTLSNSDGVVLQSSDNIGRPMQYTVTPTTMVKGFTEGIAKLGKGGKAILYLPADLAYGENGGGQIGPNQALKFEIEVVNIVTAEEMKASMPE